MLQVADHVSFRYYYVLIFDVICVHLKWPFECNRFGEDMPTMAPVREQCGRIKSVSLVIVILFCNLGSEILKTQIAILT